MDKDLLAVIGKLYLENVNLYNTVDYLQKQLKQLTETEKSIATVETE
jgi:hypothetical protein